MMVSAGLSLLACAVMLEAASGKPAASAASSSVRRVATTS
jgi:hypothetical protein